MKHLPNAALMSDRQLNVGAALVYAMLDKALKPSAELNSWPETNRKISPTNSMYACNTISMSH